MDKHFCVYGTDEFNALQLSPINLTELDRNGKEFYVDTTESFDIIFEEFDRIIVCKDNFIDSQYIQHAKVNKTEEEVAYRDRVFQYVTQNGMTRYEPEFDGHIYKYTFSRISKLMQERRLNTINPKESDYTRVKQQLSHIESPIICINGRNFTKPERIPQRNDLMRRWIGEAHKLGAYVVNVTLDPPGLQLDNYIEVGHGVFTYSEMVSYFMNSNCVISIGSSGGISTHLCTGANFAVQCERLFWVNNPEFGHNGMTIMDARKQFMSPETFLVTDNYDIVPRLMSLKKPENVQFFDESKLMFL